MQPNEPTPDQIREALDQENYEQADLEAARLARLAARQQPAIVFPPRYSPTQWAERKRRRKLAKASRQGNRRRR